MTNLWFANESARPLVYALCRLRRPSVPALRTALAFGGAVFRRCGRLLGVSSRLQPLRGLQRPAVGAGMHFYPQFAIVDPHRTQSVLVALVAHWAYFGLFRAQRAAFVRPAKNARNDVHAVISDLSLVLPILCQCSGLPCVRGAVSEAD